MVLSIALATFTHVRLPQLFHLYTALEFCGNFDSIFFLQIVECFLNKCVSRTFTFWYSPRQVFLVMQGSLLESTQRLAFHDSPFFFLFSRMWLLVTMVTVHAGCVWQTKYEVYWGCFVFTLHKSSEPWTGQLGSLFGRMWVYWACCKSVTSHLGQCLFPPLSSALLQGAVSEAWAWRRGWWTGCQVLRSPSPAHTAGRYLLTALRGSVNIRVSTYSTEAKHPLWLR